MQSFLLPCMLLYIATTLHPASGAHTSTFTRSNKARIINIHNFHRATTTYPAANMMRMYWSNTLASIAQQQAKSCRFKHSRHYRVPHGQNIYATSQLISSSYDVNKFLGSWANEQHANYARIQQKKVYSGRSVGKGMYDHYSAMVWYRTNRVGCAYATNCGGKWKSIVVCNYHSPGNVRRRGWYTVGKRCSKCPRGYDRCYHGLCSK